MGNRKPCIFTETDVKRFVHAVVAAGLPVHGVNLSLDRKEITVLTNKDAAVTIARRDMKSITPEELRKLI
jgi:hypothetical protein